MQFQRPNRDPHKVAHAHAVVEAPDGLAVEESPYLLAAEITAIHRLKQAHLAQPIIKDAQSFEGGIVDGFHVISAGGRK